MIVVAIAIVMGWRLKSREFWKYGISAVIFNNLFGYLFYAGGTLANPEKDGPITRIIREATSDGPMMGLFAICVLLFIWGGTIFLLRKGYKKAKAEIKPLELSLK